MRKEGEKKKRNKGSEYLSNEQDISIHANLIHAQLGV